MIGIFPVERGTSLKILSLYISRRDVGVLPVVETTGYMTFPLRGMSYANERCAIFPRAKGRKIRKTLPVAALPLAVSDFAKGNGAFD
jgi:hypothetical protein